MIDGYSTILRVAYRVLTWLQSWKGLLPYFRKSEKFVPAVRNGRSESVDLDIHGVEGPIMVFL